MCVRMFPTRLLQARLDSVPRPRHLSNNQQARYQRREARKARDKQLVERWRFRQVEMIMLAEFVELFTPVQYGGSSLHPVRMFLSTHSSHTMAVLTPYCLALCCAAIFMVYAYYGWNKSSFLGFVDMHLNVRGELEVQPATLFAASNTNPLDVLCSFNTMTEDEFRLALRWVGFLTLVEVIGFLILCNLIWRLQVRCGVCSRVVCCEQGQCVVGQST